MPKQNDFYHIGPLGEFTHALKGKAIMTINDYDELHLRFVSDRHKINIQLNKYLSPTNSNKKQGEIL